MGHQPLIDKIVENMLLWATFSCSTMKLPSSHTSGLSLPLYFAAALGACEESPCVGAKEYDFSRNTEHTQAFYDEGISVDSCYHPTRNAATPPLESTKIPLHFNILYYDGVEINDIKNGIRRDLAALNYAFDPLDVSFYPSGITEIKDNGVLEFIKSMKASHEEEAFDLRLRRQFMENFPTTAGSPVYYFPKTNEVDGFAGHTAPFIYYNNPNYQDPWVEKDGYNNTSSSLAHEVGHILELKHPFRADGKGDGLSDTLDYYETCGISMNDWSPYPVETSVENGTCYVGCSNSCGYKAPANVMDYFHCDPDVPMVFSVQQEQILNCALQDSENPLSKYLNKDLPEVEL